MPFIVHRPVSEKRLEEELGIKLKPGTQPQPVNPGPALIVDETKPYYWEGQMLTNGYGRTRENFLAEYSLPEDALPCLIETSEARNGADKSRLLRAYRKLAQLMARFSERYRRYLPEYRKDAVDDLEEGVIGTQEIWGPFECRKRRKS